MQEITSVNQISDYKSGACHQCVHKRSVPGSTHSSCAKKDVDVKVNPYGFENGWAFHPFDFDPIWIEECDSFLDKNGINFENVTDGVVKIYILIKYIKQKIIKQQNLERLTKLSNLMDEFLVELNGRQINELPVEELALIYSKIMKI